MNILLTGAAGFVASAMAKNLIKHGNNVRLVDNYYKPSNLVEIEGVPIEHVDIREISDLWDIEVLIHCAAISGIGECNNNPELSNSVNVKGTFNLLKCLNPKAKIIFPSSSAVYGVCQESPITEAHPEDPRGVYGKTKLEGEKLVKLHNRYVILRFSNIYGYGLFCKRTVTDLFIEKALSDKPLEVKGDGRQRRDFVHINDAIRSYMLAIKSDLNGCYNIGGNQALNINEIAELVNKGYQKKTGLRLAINHLPDDGGIAWKDFEYSSKLAKDRLLYEPLYSVGDEIMERFNTGR